MGGTEAAGGGVSRRVESLAVAVAALFMLYSCVLDSGVSLQRRTVFDSCKEADSAATESQRISVEAERDGDFGKMTSELAYQSTVIWENPQCFPTDTVLEAWLHLDN